MHARVRALVALLASTLCFSPVPTAAQTDTDSSSGPYITAEQARDAFITAGYATDPIIDWAWRTPSLEPVLRTFEVHDRPTQRAVMVLVFPSVEAAGVLRGELDTEQRSDRQDPVLLAGYGPSTWRGNVAMVEGTEPDLAMVAQPQADQDEDPSTRPDPQSPVDPDFQQALNSSDINL
jgi:hypothetical protein